MGHVSACSVWVRVCVCVCDGQLNLPGVIDGSGWTLVSCILSQRHVSMTMSDGLPISATYTDVPLEEWEHIQQEPLTGATIGSHPVLSHWTSFFGFTWGMCLIPGRQPVGRLWVQEHESIFLCARTGRSDWLWENTQGVTSQRSSFWLLTVWEHNYRWKLTARKMQLTVVGGTQTGGK